MNAPVSSTNVVGKRYWLHRQIGAGAMGSVYQATDKLLGQTVALKRLSGNEISIETTQASDIYRLALGHEFQTLASLRHPNVISVLDYGFDESHEPYFTMPFLEQAQNVTQAGKGLLLTEKVSLLIQILQALVYLHRQGIVHRDLKPDNVLVLPTGQVKVLDFGIARNKTQTGRDHVAGTPLYIAPEVWQGATPTTSSDLYAVGVIAFQLFTDQLPFPQRDSIKEFIDAAQTSSPNLTLLEDLITREAVLPAPARTVHPTEPSTAGFSEKTRLAQIKSDHLKKTISIANRRAPTRHSQSEEPGTIFLRQPLIDKVPDAPVEPDQTTTALTSHPLVAIVGKLLARSTFTRYAHAEDVILDLQDAIGGLAPTESSDVRDSFLQTAKFIGRETELVQLLMALDLMRDSRGSLWLIGGESGVGKSRLLDELRIRAIVEGTLVVRGQAVADRSAPYELWREALRRLIIGTELDDFRASVLQQIVPDIAQLLGRELKPAPLLEGEAAEQRLLSAIRDLILSYLRDAPDGLIIILEDLQWASKDLAIIQALMPLLENQRMMLVGSYRIDEDPTLPQKLPGSHEISLHRLDAQHIADLSASMLGEIAAKPHVVEYLQRQTEGNVFFLVEVIRALAEEAGQLDLIGDIDLPTHVVASGMQRILQRRIEHVPPQYRLLLDLAAITGRQLDLAVLTQLAGTVSTDDWLTACVNAAVIEFQDDRWRFTHDKLREFLLENLSVDQRLTLYRQVAETVETVHADTLEQRAYELAYLWSQADNRAKEFEYSKRAGHRSLELDAYPEADKLLTRALTLIDQPGTSEYQSEAAEIHIDLGRTYENLGSFDQAKDHLNKALTLSHTLNDAGKSAAVLLNLGWISMYEGNIAQGAQYSAESASVAQQANNLQGLARARYLTAITHLVAGEYTQADEILMNALVTAESANDRRATADILNAWGGAAERLGHLAEAREHLEEAKLIAIEIGHKTLLANVEGNIGHLTYTGGFYIDSKEHFGRAAMLFHELGNVFGEAQALYYLGFIEIAANRNVQALAYLQRAIEAGTRINALPITLNALVGVARLLSNLAKLWDMPQYCYQAVEMLTAVLNHPAKEADVEIEENGRPLLDQLQAALPSDHFSAAVERGKTRELDSIVAEVAMLDI